MTCRGLLLRCNMPKGTLILAVEVEYQDGTYVAPVLHEALRRFADDSVSRPADGETDVVAYKTPAHVTWEFVSDALDDLPEVRERLMKGFRSDVWG